MWVLLNVTVPFMILWFNLVFSINQWILVNMMIIICFWGKKTKVRRTAMDRVTQVRWRQCHLLLTVPHHQHPLRLRISPTRVDHDISNCLIGNPPSPLPPLPPLLLSLLPSLLPPPCFRLVQYLPHRRTLTWETFSQELLSTKNWTSSEI